MTLTRLLDASARSASPGKSLWFGQAQGRRLDNHSAYLFTFVADTRSTAIQRREQQAGGGSPLLLAVPSGFRPLVHVALVQPVSIPRGRGKEISIGKPYLDGCLAIGEGNTVQGINLLSRQIG